MGPAWGGSQPVRKQRLETSPAMALRDASERAVKQGPASPPALTSTPGGPGVCAREGDNFSVSDSVLGNRTTSPRMLQSASRTVAGGGAGWQKAEYGTLLEPDYTHTHPQLGETKDDGSCSPNPAGSHPRVLFSTFPNGVGGVEIPLRIIGVPHGGGLRSQPRKEERFLSPPSDPWLFPGSPRHLSMQATGSVYCWANRHTCAERKLQVHTELCFRKLKITSQEFGRGGGRNRTEAMKGETTVHLRSGNAVFEPQRWLFGCGYLGTLP
ncbi:hypothetical protein JRQ81_004491 [Phrynocephalus forsythii]|uniref:Uncharacterized protein n=1 Tax=Phrynocephalus forsythii TaxID=171643 RepID=A0A9Q1AV91_9SAUR|nr:hypothetical protein JRQ81_004491 [Phrynocephalus forsythii]